MKIWVRPHFYLRVSGSIGRRGFGTFLFAAMGVVTPAAFAQSTQLAEASYPSPAAAPAAPALPETIPDAPVPAADLQSAANPQSATPTDAQPKQTKRILGIIPNFRAVSADTKLPPQTVKQKFTTTMQQTFDYSSFLFVGILAGIDEGENSTPEFHKGAAGYGRYYWHTLADQTDENLWVQFILPSVTHEDSRYYTLGHGNIAKRALYAFDRTLITRTDADTETFNISEVVGAGAAAGISYTYYPAADKTWTKTGQLWLENIIIDGGTYVFQEFWPDINSALFHQKD